MKRILVAVDHSESSLRAADFAAELAGAHEAEMVLLSVLDRLPDKDAGLEAFARTEGIRDPVSHFTLAAAEEALAGVREMALAKGAAKIHVEVAVGDAAEQILAYAKRGEADLIVVGTRGHGRLAGLLIGSVGLKVVSLADCPVLVVR